MECNIARGERRGTKLILKIKDYSYQERFEKLGLTQAIDLMSRVFANGPGDRGSIPGRVIPKTLKMVLDVALLNSQHYKVRMKGKVEQSREWSSTLYVVAIEKGAFGSP